MVIMGVICSRRHPRQLGCCARAASGAPRERPGLDGEHALREALRDRSFLLLAAGFFVCGFHVAFIATHLPGVVALCGLPPSVGAWSLAAIGLFNIVGSLAMGWAIITAGA